MKRFIEFIFFGNWFYAICVVALSISSSLLQEIFFTYSSYYLVLGFATILYYTHAYAGIFKLPNNKEPKDFKNLNERQIWYINHQELIFIVQVLLSIGIIVNGFIFIYEIRNDLIYLRIQHILFILPFIITGILYYGNIYFPNKKISLRVGLLKPFVISFVWAGIVSLYPSIINSVTENSQLFTSKTVFSFIENFLFISILCILFDIKDYKDDYNKQLKTFVVRFGKRNTINKIIIPMTILYFTFTAWMGLAISIQSRYIIIYSFMAVLLMIIAVKIFKSKDLFFYLISIDGLLLLKAVLEILVSL